MRASNRPLVGLAAVAALAFPALAPAKKPDHADGGHHGSPHVKKEKSVSWNAKGTVTEVGDDAVTVVVAHSNRHGRALRELEVTFDLSSARIVTQDTNGDGERNLDDVSVGDLAKVQARRPKTRALAEGEVLPAKKAIFEVPEPEESEDLESESGA